MTAPKNIVELRQLLAEKFPGVRILSQSTVAPERSVFPTGLAQIDGLLSGGVARGGITEVVAAPGSGGALLIHALLQQVQATNQFLALIDGADSFDPGSTGEAALRRLLWLRCRNADQAMKAVDLLSRDRNFPLLVLDLAANPAAELRKVQPTAWYRLQRILEHSSAVLVAITPKPMISSAQVRLNLGSRFEINDTLRDRAELFNQLIVTVAQERKERISQSA